MSKQWLSTLLSLSLIACGGSSSDSPNATPPPPGGTPYARPMNTTCLAGNRAGVSGIILVDAFPSLSFNVPLAMISAPSGNTVYVIERSGIIRYFANSASSTATTVFGDISARVDTTGEGGLLGLAFDPNFSSNGYVYLSYTTPVSNPIQGTSVMKSRISRFPTNTGRTQLLTNNEEILLEIDQPYSNHNGGQITFGPDGYLYIGFGDGGDANDTAHNGQNTATLLGAMLRIDVRTADAVRGKPYSIPANNPFAVNTSCAVGACPEIYAWGLRNPWRWSFDRATGQLWVGDVGQDQREEIDLVTAGTNYGWGCYEGTRFNTEYTGSCSGVTNTPPVIEYDHTQGRAVTGGYVYRGTQIAGLIGQYVFSDSNNGRIWTVTNPYTNPNLNPPLTTGMGVYSMAEDAAGELYVLNAYDGKIYRLAPDPNSTPTDPFASQLSQTGCANPADPKQASAGMIPYEINAPLWSDNASKQRWMALPNNAGITIESNNDWTFPIGTVLRKDFYLNNIIVETRLLARHTDGEWGGYSYRWNDSQTDATLLANSDTRAVNNQTWTFPSRTDCLTCHTTAAGRALGPETAQINRIIADPVQGGQINQLSYFDLMALFTSSPGNPATLPKLAEYDNPSNDLTLRARAYLHVNCSACHRPNSTSNSPMDLRYTASFTGMNVCNALSVSGNVLGATHLLAPGNISDSIIYQRMTQAAGAQRMPALGTSIAHPLGLQLMSDWISSITACP